MRCDCRVGGCEPQSRAVRPACPFFVGQCSEWGRRDALPYAGGDGPVRPGRHRQRAASAPGAGGNQSRAVRPACPFFVRLCSEWGRRDALPYAGGNGRARPRRDWQCAATAALADVRVPLWVPSPPFEERVRERRPINLLTSSWAETSYAVDV